MKYKIFIKAILTMTLLSNSVTLLGEYKKEAPESLPFRERRTIFESTAKKQAPPPKLLRQTAEERTEELSRKTALEVIQRDPETIKVQFETPAEEKVAQLIEEKEAETKSKPQTETTPPKPTFKPLKVGEALAPIRIQPDVEPTQKPLLDEEAAPSRKSEIETGPSDSTKPQVDAVKLTEEEEQIKNLEQELEYTKSEVIIDVDADKSERIMSEEEEAKKIKELNELRANLIEKRSKEAQATGNVVAQKPPTPIIDPLKALDTEIDKSEIAIKEQARVFGTIQTKLTTADGLAANHKKSIATLETEGGSEKLLKSTTAQVAFLEKAIRDAELKKSAGESGAAVEKLGEFYKQLGESKKIIEQLNKMHDAIAKGNKGDADKIKNDLTKYFESEKEKAEAEAAKIKTTFLSMTPDAMKAKNEELVQLKTKKENLIKQLIKENDNKAKILSQSIGKKSKEIAAQEKKAAKLGQANKKLQSKLRTLEQQGKNPNLSESKKKSLDIKISTLRKKVVSSMENESKEWQKLGDLDLEKNKLESTQKELDKTQKNLKGLVSTGNM